MASRESEDRFRIGNLLADFSGGVEGIRGGYYGADGHNSQTHNGEVDRVRRQEEDDVAFSDANIGETGGDGIDGSPEIREGEVAACGGVDEGDLAMVGPGRYESGDVEGMIGWVRTQLAFAVEDRIRFAETTSRIDGHVFVRHGSQISYDLSFCFFVLCLLF